MTRSLNGRGLLTALIHLAAVGAVSSMVMVLPQTYAQEADEPDAAEEAEAETTADSQSDTDDSGDSAELEQNDVETADSDLEEQEATGDEPDMEQVLVTGSRIKRTEFSSTAPIEVITSEKAVLAGLMSTTDILQGSTVAAGQQIDDSFSGFVTDGGPGANQISLRGLGGQRSLLLVNGKRWMPSGVRGSVNSVDLTAVPTSIINRYEILKDGASSVYGADAVAGVVNVITQSTTDGGEVNFSTFVPEIGVGENYIFDAAWGKTGGNWNITFAGSVDYQKSIKQTDLDYAKCETQPRLTDRNEDGTIDNRHPDTKEELCFGFIYGFLDAPLEGLIGVGRARYEPSLAVLDPENRYYRYDEDRIDEINELLELPPLEQLIFFPTNYYTTAPRSGFGEGDPLLDNDGPFYRDTRSPEINDVQTKGQIYSFSSFGNLDFSIADRSTQVYYELYMNRRKTHANNGYRQFFPLVPKDNPFNPYGDFSPIGAALLPRDAPPDAIGDGVSVQAVVPSYEFGPTGMEIDIKRIQTFAGIKGDISATWTYEAYLGYGFSDGRYRWPAYLADRVEASLDARPDDFGNVICKDLVNFPDCKPINVFNEDAMLHGRFPQGVVDFIVADTEGRTVYKGYTFSAYATGEIFNLPAGEAYAVFGYEFRQEYLDDTPDEESVAGNIYASSASLITRGKDAVNEAYAELELPVLRNIFLAEDLKLNLSTRFTDYESYGSDTTFRAAMDWQLFDEWRIRATHGNSFRAPALYEQHLGDQTGFVSGFIDPCKTYQNDSLPGDPVFDNCEAQNLPADFSSLGDGIEVIIGGSNTLDSEKADSTTFGLVYQPDAVDFSLGLNRWEINVEDTVSALSASRILETCYDTRGLSSPFCKRVGPRGPRGEITFVDSSFLNVGTQHVSGIDVDLLYQKEFPTLNFAADFTLTYMDEFYEDILGERLDYVGHFAVPEFNGEVDFLVTWRDWVFNWRADWIGSTEEEPIFDPDTTIPNRITSTDDYFYHSFTTAYRGTRWGVVGTISNVFDQDPPLVADGTGSPSAARIFNTIPGAGYPLIGRSFILRFNYEFN